MDTGKTTTNETPKSKKHVTFNEALGMPENDKTLQDNTAWRRGQEFLWQQRRQQEKAMFLKKEALDEQAVGVGKNNKGENIEESLSLMDKMMKCYAWIFCIQDMKKREGIKPKDLEEEAERQSFLSYGSSMH